MRTDDALICQLAEIAVYQRDSIAPMRVRVEPEPGYPHCVRAVMSYQTWSVIACDDNARALFWDTMLDYPEGLHPLMAQEYRTAAKRYDGELPMQGWFADLYN